MPLKKDMIDPNDRDQVMEVAVKYLFEDLQRGEPIESPEITQKFLNAKLKNQKHETFWAMFLDTRHRVISFEKLFTGTVDAATVYPRVVAQRALELNAAAIIVAHNHPSGINEPSLADQAITRRLKDALALLDIRLLDHFVVGDGRPVSMATQGLM